MNFQKANELLKNDHEHSNQVYNQAGIIIFHTSGGLV